MGQRLFSCVRAQPTPTEHLRCAYTELQKGKERRHVFRIIAVQDEENAPSHGATPMAREGATVSVTLTGIPAQLSR